MNENIRPGVVRQEAKAADFIEKLACSCGHIPGIHFS
jgi:hypothetical protein